VLQGLLSKVNVDANQIDEVILGQVLSAGCGQNPARQTAIHAGIPVTTSALTINKVCGSGLKAVHMAHQAIQCGDAQLVVAGGQESMSQAAHVLPNSRNGQRLGNWNMIDTMVHDGLWDELTTLLNRSGSMGYARTLVNNHLARAIDALFQFPESESRNALEWLTRLVMERNE